MYQIETKLIMLLEILSRISSFHLPNVTNKSVTLSSLILDPKFLSWSWSFSFRCIIEVETIFVRTREIFRHRNIESTFISTSPITVAREFSRVKHAALIAVWKLLKNGQNGENGNEPLNRTCPFLNLVSARRLASFINLTMVQLCICAFSAQRIHFSRFSLVFTRANDSCERTCLLNGPFEKRF